MIRPHMSLFGTAPAPFEKKFQKTFILAFDVKNRMVSLNCTFFWILVYCVKIRSDGCHCSQWSFQKEKRQKTSQAKNEMQFSWHITMRFDALWCVCPLFYIFLVCLNNKKCVNKNSDVWMMYIQCTLYIIDDVWNSKHI